MERRNRKGKALQTAPLPPHNRDHPHSSPKPPHPTREPGIEGLDYSEGLGRWMCLEEIKNGEMEEGTEK